MNDEIKHIKLPFDHRVGNCTSLYIEMKVGDRAAKCGTCDRLSKSSPKLPHFESKPELLADYYYCGCRGWD